MSEMISEQGRIFLVCMAFGAVTGIWYDVFRTIRRKGSHGNLETQVQDIFFVLTTMAGSFLLVQRIHHGTMRFYMLAGAGLGVVLYETLFHPVVAGLFAVCFDLVLTITGILWYFVFSPLKKILKYSLNFLKNTARTVKMIHSRL